VIRLRLPNDDALAQPAQAEPVPLVEIVEALRGCWRHRAGLTKMLHDAPLFAEDRDHVPILS
jgi:hypothetical protein